MAQKKLNKTTKAALLLLLFIGPAAVFYFLIYAGVHKVNRLKFYGPKITETKTVRGGTVTDTIYHQIPGFTLNVIPSDLNFNSKNLEGRLYLGHFLDAALLNEVPKEVVYAASEILPEFPELYWITFWKHADSTKIQYILPSEKTRKLNGADARWIELYGNDSLIQSLQTEGFFKTDPNYPEPFDPSSVVLIDKEGRIRSYFNPVKQGEISNIKKEILLLYKEYELAYKTHRFIEFN